MSIAIKEFLKVLGSPQNPDSGRPLIGLESSREKNDRCVRDRVGLVFYGLPNDD